MIYISNDIYLSGVSNAVIDPNYPLIGWRSVLRPEDITGTSDGDYRAAWSADTYTAWVSDAGLTNAYMILGNVNIETINYIGFVGHNLAGGSYKIQGGPDGTTWTDITPFRQVVDNRAIMDYFPDSTYRYYQIVMSSPAPRVWRIAHVKMGLVLRLQRKMYVGISPPTLNKRVEKVNTVSDSGKYLGGIAKSLSHRYEINQPDNKPAFVRAQIDPFLDHAELLWTVGNGPVGTFILAWRPSEYPLEVVYCHPPEQIRRPVNQRNNGMMEWSISGEAEAWQSV